MTVLKTPNLICLNLEKYIRYTLDIKNDIYQNGETKTIKKAFIKTYEIYRRKESKVNELTIVGLYMIKLLPMEIKQNICKFGEIIPKCYILSKTVSFIPIFIERKNFNIDTSNIINYNRRTNLINKYSNSNMKYIINNQYFKKNNNSSIRNYHDYYIPDINQKFILILHYGDGCYDFLNISTSPQLKSTIYKSLYIPTKRSINHH